MRMLFINISASTAATMKKYYEPAEDSHLLAEAVGKYAFGKVLDMGTGSGIQAIAAAKKKEVKSVVAADVNNSALKHAAAAAEKERVANKIAFVKSDLFASIKGKFDTIIFNPPYLPQDKGIVDVAIYGGRHGYEVLEKFLDGCSRHLNGSGIILVAFSSITNRQKVDEAVEQNCLESETLQEKRHFFETIYIYLIRKSPLLLELERKGIKNASLFEKGNRGVIYLGRYNGKTIAVKAKLRESKAVATVENEASWIGRLNGAGIGPKLLFAEKEWLAYEFVAGKFILDYLGSCNATDAVDVIKQMLRQARKLDELGVNKEEMLRPQRHAIVNGSGKIVMIDFERCHMVTRPKNVTQLCQFIARGYVNSLLRQKGIAIDREKLLAAAKDYKREQTEGNFSAIVELYHAI